MNQSQILFASILAVLAPSFIHSTFSNTVVYRKLGPDPYRPYRYGRSLSTPSPPRFNRSISDNSGWVPLVKPAESYVNSHKSEYPAPRYQTHYIILYPSHPSHPQSHSYSPSPSHSPPTSQVADHSPSLSVVTPQGKPVAYPYTYGHDYKYETPLSLDTSSYNSIGSGASSSESSTASPTPLPSDTRGLAEIHDYKKLYPEVKTYYYPTTSLKEYEASLATGDKGSSVASYAAQYAPYVDASKTASLYPQTQDEPVYYYTLAKPSVPSSSSALGSLSGLSALALSSGKPASTPIEEPAQEPAKQPVPVSLFKKAVVQHIPVISPAATAAPHQEKKEDDEEKSSDEKYEFGYRVHDSYTGSEFGQMEQRHGSNSRGHYHVMLPDGRLQVVRYYTDHSGFHADVSYEGKATHHG